MYEKVLIMSDQCVYYTSVDHVSRWALLMHFLFFRAQAPILLLSYFFLGFFILVLILHTFCALAALAYRRTNKKLSSGKALQKNN
jgi:hypothetical protein